MGLVGQQRVGRQGQPRRDGRAAAVEGLRRVRFGQGVHREGHAQPLGKAVGFKARRRGDRVGVVTRAAGQQVQVRFCAGGGDVQQAQPFGLFDGLVAAGAEVEQAAPVIVGWAR